MCIYILIYIYTHNIYIIYIVYTHNIYIIYIYIYILICIYKYTLMYISILSIYLSIYILYVYLYIYLYINWPVNVIVKLSHPRSGDSQGHETFLVPSADKQTRNYDTECSNQHPFSSTLRSKGLIRSKMKWWAIYTNWPVNLVVKLPHPWSGDSQGQKTLLTPMKHIYISYI